MSVALAIIAFTFLGALALGLRARSGRQMSLEQWTVGGRGFGTLLVFLLMAGEIYTTFAFLGGSGLAYGKGGPAYYILCYLALIYVISYWLLPPIWAYAKARNLFSQPDFFAAKYESRGLGLLVAVVGIVSLVPYMVLQLKGLGIIVSTASYGAVSPAAAIWIGAAGVTAYVVVSGVRGSAWTAAIKDVLILFVVVFLGLYLPYHYYGGIAPMFEAIEAARPGFLALPERGQSAVWFASTTLLTALGGYAWPHVFASLYTASDPRTFRRNAVILPLYQLVLLFVLFCGFAAVLQVPGLKGADADLSLFKLALQTFPPWFVGVIGATGVLTALVPGSMILMSGATLVANNLYRPLSPAATDASTARLAKGIVPVLALVCVGFALHGGDTIVQLLLMGYNFVTQLFPALLASLMRRNPLTAAGAIAGIVAGVGSVAATVILGLSVGGLFPFLPAALQDINVGVLALTLNVVVAVAVSRWGALAVAAPGGRAY
ncbi:MULTISPECIES: sodium:solute symporter [Methylobacterium]|uniref:Symporter YodF n=1 Tax=Methylobacterium jeotgali TaxID=381630 RepID=A0ABQ4SQE3_9HYPH|nr:MULTISPECIES: sodium:solute symporter [Methylobacterium]PIU07614.1 MAG: sodium:solute symporter [Methylobacterium sp. CG09_land_8_20_14_0_10_71_15]PIU12938.1 MAG: sodium:solute symporter [Methylobacterium sp. CG08_land_8_20_14_0_20_71_15]GBU15932.1 putative symporter YhjB [Methylobacterium sp.]GJE05385.1 putative symporter YodF [Methylobacterium jeotgali]